MCTAGADTRAAKERPASTRYCDGVQHAGARRDGRVRWHWARVGAASGTEANRRECRRVSPDAVRLEQFSREDSVVRDDCNLRRTVRCLEAGRSGQVRRPEEVSPEEVRPEEVRREEARREEARREEAASRERLEPLARCHRSAARRSARRGAPLPALDDAQRSAARDLSTCSGRTTRIRWRRSRTTSGARASNALELLALRPPDAIIMHYCTHYSLPSAGSASSATPARCAAAARTARSARSPAPTARIRPTARASSAG